MSVCCFVVRCVISQVDWSCPARSVSLFAQRCNIENFFAKILVVIKIISSNVAKVLIFCLNSFAEKKKLDGLGYCTVNWLIR